MVGAVSAMCLYLCSYFLLGMADDLKKQQMQQFVLTYLMNEWSAVFYQIALSLSQGLQ